MLRGVVSRPLSLIVIGAALAVASCKDKPAPPTAAVAAPSARPSAVASATGSPAAPALDDLLHFTDARIGVSSKVENPRDFAEHVADGRLDTAWNGKTGDLVGGWIGFRVPAAARVKLIELTAGYAATSRKGEDLFALNHRIARVRVTRDGVSLGEHALDPDSRAFQRIALDAPGGDFKIEVLAVKPGTRAAWRELVMSELRVFGVAGAAKRAAASIPHVQVGSLDALPAAAATTVAPRKREADTVKVIPAGEVEPDLECGSWTAPLTFQRAQLLDGGLPGSLPWEPPDPSCDFAIKQTRGDTKLVLFARTDLRESYRELGIERGGRLFLLQRPFDQQSHFDPHCSGASGAKLHSARLEGDAAIFVIYGWSIANPWPQALEDGGLESTGGSSERSLEEIRCVLGPAGATPACTMRILAEKRDDAPDPSVSDGPAPLPWK